MDSKPGQAAFDAKWQEFLDIVIEMIADDPNSVASGYQPSLSQHHHTQQLKEELMSHFSEESRDFLLSRDLDLIDKLPLLRESSTTLGNFKGKERGVYVCKVRLKIRDEQNSELTYEFYLYVGMGGSVMGFDHRVKKHFSPGTRLHPSECPLFYALLRQNPEFEMTAYALAVWPACPSTFSDALADPDYQKISLAEAFSIWQLDTSLNKLKRPVDANTGYTGLNVRTGVEARLPFKILGDASSEDARDAAQDACSMTWAELRRRITGGETWVTIWRAKNLHIWEAAMQKIREWSKNNPELAAQAREKQKESKEYNQLMIVELFGGNGRTVTLSYGNSVKFRLLGLYVTIPKEQVPPQLRDSKEASVKVKVIVDGPAKHSVFHGRYRTQRFAIEITPSISKSPFYVSWTPRTYDFKKSVLDSIEAKLEEGYATYLKRLETLQGPDPWHYNSAANRSKGADRSWPQSIDTRARYSAEDSDTREGEADNHIETEAAGTDEDSVMQEPNHDGHDEEPTNISREFLEALPSEIQKELLQQEAQDRRRERDEPTRTEEVDPASFFASLDPALQQDEEILAQLPEHITTEARVVPTRTQGDDPETIVISDESDEDPVVGPMRRRAAVQPLPTSTSRKRPAPRTPSSTKVQRSVREFFSTNVV